MRERLNNLMVRIDAMSLRERGLIAATAVFVIAAAWQSLLMDPLQQREKRLQKDLQILRGSLESTNEVIESSARELGAGGAEALRVELDRIERQLAATDARLADQAAELITPPQMAVVLEDVLQRQGRLRLLAIRNLEAEPLYPDGEAPEEGEEPQGAVLYRHGLEMELEGSYLDCLAYLQALEELPWRIYWSRLQLDMEEYPRNRIRITVNTLSFDEEWIGV